MNNCDDNTENIDQQYNNPTMHNTNDNPEDGRNFADYYRYSAGAGDSDHQDDPLKYVKDKDKQLNLKIGKSSIIETDIQTLDTHNTIYSNRSSQKDSCKTVPISIEKRKYQ